MPELHGNPVEVGDRILVNSQLAHITEYNEAGDRMSWVLAENNGTNIVSNHISSTVFEVLSGGLQADGLATFFDEQITENRKNSKMIADPQPEDPETGAARTSVPPPSLVSDDEITTLD